MHRERVVKIVFIVFSELFKGKIQYASIILALQNIFQSENQSKDWLCILKHVFQPIEIDSIEPDDQDMFLEFIPAIVQDKILFQSICFFARYKQRVVNEESTEDEKMQEDESELK